VKKFNTTLLIDDDPVTNMLNSRLIQKLDLSNHVEIATNGQEAVDYLRNCTDDKRPNLILLDINMPVMNGFEFMEMYEKEFAEDNECVILMMLTTSANSADLEKARAYNQVTEFMSKPLNKAKIELIREKYLSE